MFINKIWKSRLGNGVMMWILIGALSCNTESANQVTALTSYVQGQLSAFSGSSKEAENSMQTTGLLQNIFPTAPKPDIIVLMVDDMDMATWDALIASGYASNLKELAKEGVTFDNSFVTNAVCCPSRATFLSGQYTQNHGVYTVAGGIAYWARNLIDKILNPNDPGEDETIAVWMQRAGYRTSLVGKYLNGYGYFTSRSYVPPGYNEWFGLLDPSTYRVYDYFLNENGNQVFYGSSENEYQTDVLTNKAVQILKNSVSQNANDPIFMYLTPIAPHFEVLPNTLILNSLIDYESHFYESIRPPKRWEHLADADSSNGELASPLPKLFAKPSFNEADVSDKPPFVSALLPLKEVDMTHGIDLQFKKRVAASIAVDEMLSKIKAQQKSVGRWENTVIIFTSDNGYFFGEHRLSSKLLAYEESIRVPLVIRGPGIPAGVRRSGIAINTDLAPTVIELAGVTNSQIGRVIDGRSLMPLATQGDSSWTRKQFMVEHYLELNGIEVPGIGDLSPNTYKAIRRLTKAVDNLYVQWYEADWAFKPLGAVEFLEYYGHGTDPYQLENSSATLPANALNERKQTVESFSSCAGQTCRDLEDL